MNLRSFLLLCILASTFIHQTVGKPKALPDPEAEPFWWPGTAPTAFPISVCNVVRGFLGDGAAFLLCVPECLSKLCAQASCSGQACSCSACISSG